MTASERIRAARPTGLRERFDALARYAFEASDGKEVAEIAIKQLADGSLRWAAFVTYADDRCFRIAEPAPEYAPLWATRAHTVYETEEV